MHYTKITTFSLFILFIGLLTACNDDLSNNIIDSNIDTEDVNEFKELFTSKELKDAEPNLVSDIQAEKRMKFNSLSSFNLFMHKYANEANASNKKSSDFINDRYNFKSLQYYQNERNEFLIKGNKAQIASNTDLDSTSVDDPYFSSILNEKGVLEVDTLILDIDSDYGYIFIGENFYNEHADSLSKSKLEVNHNSESNNATTKHNKDSQISTLSLNSSNYIKFKLPDDNSSGSNSGDSNGSGEVGSGKEIPNKVSKKYKSGGKKRKFKGVSWNRNYLLYASLGAKSVHKTKKLGVFWKSKADVITLNSTASWSNSFDLLPFKESVERLKVSLGDVLSLLELNDLISKIEFLEPGGKLEETIRNFKIKVKLKPKTNLYKIDIREFEQFSATKINSKKVKHRFDYKTAIFTIPPKLPKFSKKFDLDFIESMHSMDNYGHSYNFNTLEKN